MAERIVCHGAAGTARGRAAGTFFAGTIWALAMVWGSASARADAGEGTQAGGTVTAGEQGKASSDGWEIEEIVVTARRRSESVLKVPGSVSAFDEEMLGDLQATDMRRVQFAVPNFYFERGDSSNAVVYLRGIGQNDSLPFVEPGVAVYVDDVYMARTQAAFLELFDVERIEVLRGPQGTLYGRNSPGGAVKLITRQPGDTLEAHFEIGVGRFALATTNARLMGPLNDTASLKGKLAFTLTHRNGFSRNVVEGGHDGDTALGAWRAQVVWEPNSDFRFSFTNDGKIERPKRSLTPIRKTALTVFPDPVGNPAQSIVFPPTEDGFGSPYVVEGTANDFADLTTYGFSIDLRWNLSATWTLNWVVSHRELDWDLLLDADDTPFADLDIPVFEHDRQTTNEVRMSYVGESGFTFTGGIYAFHDFDKVLAGFDDLNAPFSFGGFTIPIFTVGVPSSGYGESRQRTDSFAVFADATMPLGSGTSLELGLRYTYDEKRMRRRNEFFFNPNLFLSRDFPPFLSGLGFPGEDLRGKKDFDAFTPRIVLSHELNDNSIVYASVSRGFKSGGFPGRAFDSIGFEPFAPERVWTFEGGVKGQTADRQLTYSAAYFYNRYRDLQLNGFGQDPNTGRFVSLFTNAAQARIQGVEVSFAAKPLEGLSLEGSAGFLDADYQKFFTLVSGALTDVSDRRIPNSPKWTGFLGATYERPLVGDWVGVLHVDAAYRGDHANETTDSPNLAVKKVVFVSAYGALVSSDGHWELRAGVTNLTDKARAVQSFNTSEFSGVETAFMGPPRLYDVRLVYKY